MKKAGKILLFTLTLILLLLMAALSFTVGWRPFIGARTRPTTSKTFERTPERLARGRYLVTGLVGCELCHTLTDWHTHGPPNISGKELAGQVLPVPGLPGRIVASNLTPDAETGGGSWSDDQFA